MASRKQVEGGLKRIGACWAVRSDKYISPNDDFGAKPAYHVHPDSSEPHQNRVKRFESLDELMNWINSIR